MKNQRKKIMNREIEEIIQQVNLLKNAPETESLVNTIGKRLELLSEKIGREERLSRIERDLFTSPRSLDETLDHIVNIIKDEFNFSRFDLAIIDHDLKRVIRRYSKGGFGKKDLEKLCRHGALGITVNYALNNEEPLIVNDIFTQDPYWKLAEELNCWVHGTFPLYHTDSSGRTQVQGLIHGARDRKTFDNGGILNPQEVRDLQRLGLAINKAIYDARMTYFEKAIRHIISAISTARMSVETEPVLSDDLEKRESQWHMDDILDVIIENLDAQYGLILFRDQAGFTPVSFRSDKRETLPLKNLSGPERISMTDPLGLAFYGGNSIIENECAGRKNPLRIKSGSETDPVHTLLTVPLIQNYSGIGRIVRNTIGIIVLFNRKDDAGKVIATDYEGNEGGFSCTDRQILEAIAPNVETIISNTISQQNLKRLSLTDGLTGLLNHSHFLNSILTIEFKRSERYGTPLSILLSDIDHFKVFNDIFGHQVGDLVLQKVARIFRENSREVDHICRYGGEEFAILLPNTSFENAMIYIEKIRRLLDRLDFKDDIRKDGLFDINEARKRFRAILDINDENIRKAKIATMKNHFGLDLQRIIHLISDGKTDTAEEIILKAIKVTMSMGLAFYPDLRISSKKDLVTTADMLLLRAKENGRNRVEVMEMKD